MYSILTRRLSRISIPKISIPLVELAFRTFSYSLKSVFIEGSLGSIS